MKNHVKNKENTENHKTPKETMKNQGHVKLNQISAFGPSKKYARSNSKSLANEIRTKS